MGARGSSGESELQRRGYANVGGQKGDDRSYSYWWNARSRQCVTVATMDGRYASITPSPAPDCGKRQGGGAGRLDDDRRSDSGYHPDIGYRPAPPVPRRRAMYRRPMVMKALRAKRRIASDSSATAEARGRGRRAPMATHGTIAAIAMSMAIAPSSRPNSSMPRSWFRSGQGAAASACPRNSFLRPIRGEPTDGGISRTC